MSNEKRELRSGRYFWHVLESRLSGSADASITTKRAYRNIGGVFIGSNETDYASYLDGDSRDIFLAMKNMLAPDETMVVDLVGNGNIELPNRCFEDSLDIYSKEKTWVKTIYGIVEAHVDTENEALDGSHLAFLYTIDDNYPFLRVKVWDVDDRWVSQIFYNSVKLLKYVPLEGQKVPAFVFIDQTTNEKKCIEVTTPIVISVDNSGNVVDYSKALPHPVDTDYSKDIVGLYITKRVFLLSNGPYDGVVKLEGLLPYQNKTTEEQKESQPPRANLTIAGVILMSMVFFISLFLLLSEHFFRKLP